MKRLHVGKLAALFTAVCLLLLLFCTASAAGGDPLGYIVSTTSGVNIRAGAGTSYDAVGTVSASGSRVAYYAKLKSGDVIWYYINWNGTLGWVSGTCFTPEGQTSHTATPAPSAEPVPQIEPAQPEVTQSPVTQAPASAIDNQAAPETDRIRGYVRCAAPNEPIRKGAGSGYKQVGTVKQSGTLLAYYATTRNENTAWYYVIDGKNKGWVCGDHFSTDLPKRLPSPDPIGYVRSRTHKVVMRDNASTFGKKLDTIEPADAVLAYFGSKDDDWYYVLYGETYGWVSGTYFSVVHEQGPLATLTPEPTPEITATPRPVLGYVKTTAGSVNMRIRPSKDAGKVTGVGKGKVLPFHDIQENEGTTWYQVTFGKDTGWIMADYLKPDGTPIPGVVTPSPKATAAPTVAPTVPVGDAQGFMIAGSSGINIRERASRDSKRLGSLKKGDKVPWFRTEEKDGSTWYLIYHDEITGWVLGSYLTPTGTAVPTTAPLSPAVTPAVTDRSTMTPKGTMVTAAKGVNVRAIAGKNGRRLGALGKGRLVTWYDMTKVEGDDWYYISSGDLTGWVLGNLLKNAEPAKSTSPSIAPTPTATPKPTVSTDKPQGYVVTAVNSVNIRSEASTDSARVGSLSKGKRLPWYAVVTNEDDTWYYVVSGSKAGWVSGQFLTPEAEATPAATKAPLLQLDNRAATPIPTSSPVCWYRAASGVNIRAAADATSAKLGALKKGASVPCYAAQRSGTDTWVYILYGKIYGWVNSAFLNAAPSPTPTPTPTPVPTKKVTGWYKASTGVNIRAQADVKSSKLGALKKGDVVPAYASTTNGEDSWIYVVSGKIAGWVSGTSLKATTSPKPTATPTPIPTSSPVCWYKTTRTSNLLTAPGTGSKVGSVNKNATVPCYAAAKYEGVVWCYVGSGKIAGWMSSADLTSAATATPKPTAKPTVTPRPSSALGKVRSSEQGVKLRAGAGTSFSKLGVAHANVDLPYFATQNVGGVTWYYVQDGDLFGWVSGAYFKPAQYIVPDTIRPTATVSTKKVLGYGMSSTKATLRSGPDTSYSSLGSIAKGKSFPYYATKKNKTVTWYYVLDGSKGGWVSGTLFAPVKNTPKPTATPKLTAAPKSSPTPKCVTKTSGKYTMNLYPAEKIDWFKGGIQKLYPKGAIIMVYDVKTGKIWKARRWSGGNHADIEPASANDTAVLCSIYGVKTADDIAKKNLWRRRPCLVTIGTRTFACSLYGIPHGHGVVNNNKMNGQVCLHFTNSRTHGSNRIDEGHVAAITYAWNHCPAGKKK